MRISNLIKFVIALIFTHAGVYAQVVSTIPPFPGEQDSITIIFDATKGNAGMAGYSGDIYAHTGVLTNLSSGPSNWKYVIADWSINISKAKLTRVDNDKYQLVIGYPRQFYNITNPTENILELAFVFRSPDGSITGRDIGGGDIFVNL
ncbi:MAG: hypothetical protein JW995_02525, partial [Melioribacteraceae bacterium]|nr:hypothetical protein [Melioribacteraceae bacterium]